MSNTQDPLWKRIWKTQGIRYLGKDGTGHIDAMDRFEHSFDLGFKAGVAHCEEIVDRVGDAIRKKDIAGCGDVL